MSGRPKPRSDVRHRRNARSPTGREPHGDGDLVVVRDRETRSHGEAGQVVHGDNRIGTRDEKRRNDTHHHPRSEIHGLSTGEPGAVKVASTVRRGADGKGRSRLPVTALAGRTHELRRKPYLASRLPDHYLQPKSRPKREGEPVPGFSRTFDDVG